MAENDQKTQAPTAKKLADARAKGDVASAPEFRHAVMFVAALIVAAQMGAVTLGRLTPLLMRLWGDAEAYPLTPPGSQAFASGVMRAVAMAAAPLMIGLFAAAALTVLAGGRPTIAWARVEIRWSKLSPVAGMGRLFGPRALADFGKTLLKLVAVVSLAVMVVWPKAVGVTLLIGAAPGTIGVAATALVTAMVKAVALFVGVLAAVDLFVQRLAYMKRMRMSLQEVKDEARQSDGDPAIKARIRAIGMQRARRRMMAAVPTASVVITNPTHYAIALKYDHGGSSAPIVVAKGTDRVALKVREVAAAAGVPIVESPVLARALYATVDIDRPIATEHYAAVAEIIGYIMRLAKHRG